MTSSYSDPRDESGYSGGSGFGAALEGPSSSDPGGVSSSDSDDPFYNDAGGGTRKALEMANVDGAGARSLVKICDPAGEFKFANAKDLRRICNEHYAKRVEKDARRAPRARRSLRSTSRDARGGRRKDKRQEMGMLVDV